ncbi:ABC transporter permease [Aminobacter sp. MSH1]|uniref:ABC transporter permease n=1 Tax=Aminobacter sp. MSH1 TaxID=374606 RepID=UPI000D353F99|nr:ABC transporter permease [Aminobacter sp. MSH1]
MKSRSGLIGTTIFILIILMAMSSSVLFPTSPWRLVGKPLVWPGQDLRYMLGTDSMGRSLISGIFHGAKVSLGIAAVSTAVAVVFGSTIGAVAGYFGGWLDDLLMRITEAFQTIPLFLLTVVIVAILGATIGSITFAIAVVSWPGLARLVRAEAMRLRNAEFVQSCIIIGMRPERIIFTQILPNCLAPIVVMASMLVANAILTESGLAFLRLGDPNVLSWGTMIGAGRTDLRTAWYICLIPGFVVMITVLSLNLVGDGLNDALNRRLHKR